MTFLFPPVSIVVHLTACGISKIPYRFVFDEVSLRLYSHELDNDDRSVDAHSNEILEGRAVKFDVHVMTCIDKKKNCFGFVDLG
jgi:hypothetical protein